MNFSADSIPRGFDVDFTLNTVLPLAQAAYAVMQAPDNLPPLPPGWEKTALIKVAQDRLSELIGVVERIPLLHLINGEPNTFGLMGKNAETKTAFVSFRGTQNAIDWAHNSEIERRSVPARARSGRCPPGVSVRVHDAAAEHSGQPGGDVRGV